MLQIDMIGGLLVVGAAISPEIYLVLFRHIRVILYDPSLTPLFFCPGCRVRHQLTASISKATLPSISKRRGQLKAAGEKKVAT